MNQDVDTVSIMLGGILPEGTRIRVKKRGTICDWLLEEVCSCPIGRVVVWSSSNTRHAKALVDGATFCANLLCDLRCDVQPGLVRERAFRAYVSKRVREWSIHDAQDKGVAHVRRRMEAAGETMPTQHSHGRVEEKSR